jgi:hypothetical protein
MIFRIDKKISGVSEKACIEFLKLCHINEQPENLTWTHQFIYPSVDSARPEKKQVAAVKSMFFIVKRPSGPAV